MNSNPNCEYSLRAVGKFQLLPRYYRFDCILDEIFIFYKGGFKKCIDFNGGYVEK